MENNKIEELEKAKKENGLATLTVSIEYILSIIGLIFCYCAAFLLEVYHNAPTWLKWLVFASIILYIVSLVRLIKLYVKKSKIVKEMKKLVKLEPNTPNEKLYDKMDKSSSILSKIVVFVFIIVGLILLPYILSGTYILFFA